MRELYPWLDKFSLSWVVDDLIDHPSFLARRMFGGVAVYYNGLLVLVFMESTGDREWKGKTYNFDIWNGLFLPSRPERHEVLKKISSDLVTHPVLHSWLFLPMDSENFEETANLIIKRIIRLDPLIGILPKEKKRRVKIAATKNRRMKKVQPKSVGKKNRRIF